MRPARNHQNETPRSERNRFPAWGNLPILTAAADEAGRIISGRLTKGELDHVLSYCHHYGRPDDRDRKYFDSLDPEAVRLCLTGVSDQKGRFELFGALSDNSVRYFLERYPEKAKRFAEILVSVTRTKASSKIRDNFSLFRQGFLVNWRNLEKYPPDEYLEFLAEYAKVLGAFADWYSDKVEFSLENALELGYWRKFFLFLRLVRAPAGTGMFGGYKQPEYFENLTEEDIRFIADIAPKNSHYADTVLTSFATSKKKNPNHSELWKFIGNGIRANPAAGVIISSYLSGFSDKLEEDGGESFQFLCEFWRMAKGNVGYSNELTRLWALREEMGKVSGIPLASPKDSEVFQLLAGSVKESVGEFASAIHKHLRDIPEISELQTLARHAERLVKLHPEGSEPYFAVLDYLLRSRKHPESLPAIEAFFQKHQGANAITVLNILPVPYEPKWEESPLYDAAIRNEPNREAYPRDFEGHNGWLWFGEALELFVFLGRSGIPIPEIEAAFSRIARSHDAIRTMGSTIWRMKGRGDWLSLAAMFRHRPKSFVKILKTLSSILEDRPETFATYFHFASWSTLSDDELSELAGDGWGSYAELLEEKCTETGVPAEKYSKTLSGFSQAVKIYPDMRANLKKFERFERELFDLEVSCVSERIRAFYVRTLELWEELPLSALEDESLLALLHILAANRGNAEIGKKLLLQILHDQKKGQTGRFRAFRNDDWLRANLHTQQRKIWLSKNEKTYAVTDADRKTDESVGREVAKFLSVAEELLKRAPHRGMLDCLSAEAFLAGLPEFLRENPEFDQKFAKDLKLQADSINRILHRAKSRSIPSVKIYRETDPRRSIMMGDWVDGSCLASNSPIKNSWSVIANAAETNKAVFYAEDEKGNVIGRVLVAIDQNGKLVPFRVYVRGNPDVDLSKIFQKYLLEFSDTLGLPFGWKPKDVKKILDCQWYIDPTWTELNGEANDSKDE